MDRTPDPIPIKISRDEPDIYVTGRLRLATIMDLVCERYGITRMDLISHRRARPAVTARHVVCYLARVLTPLSLPQIGRVLGSRDHTTILHSIKWIEARKHEPAIAVMVNGLMAQLALEAA